MAGLIQLKWLLYLGAITYASFKDFKTKEIPDSIHIVILIAGLLTFPINNPMNALAGLLLVPIPFLVMALIKTGSIGGGDIKFMAANGFFLGLFGGMYASVVGLMLAVVINGILYKVKKIDLSVSFPLAPYLSVGCFFMLLIQQIK